MIALAGERGVGNTVEQAVIFLPLLLAHTMLIDPSQSLMISIAYSASRVIYPFLFLTRKYSMVFMSTIPGYCIQSYMSYNIAIWALEHLM